MIEKFNSELFFEVNYDYKIDAPYLTIHLRGIELIAQYYAEKYDAQLIFCADLADFQHALHEFLLENKKERLQDYRCAFIIGGHTTHAMPVIYLRENNQEAFLCADSLGTQIRFIEPNIVTAGVNQKVAKLIKQETEIKTFIVVEQRQADLYSCFTEAVIFARDCVGKNKHSQEYICKNLYQKLDERAILTHGVYQVKLPDLLLKTSQISHFRQIHREQTAALISSKETLDQFNLRYSAEYHAKSVNQYLQKKSVKFAQIIEIQYYINQLTQLLAAKLTPELKKQWVQEGKQRLALQGEIYLNCARQGLYTFAHAFYEKIQAAAIVQADAYQKLNYGFFSSPTKVLYKKASLLLVILADVSYWRSKSYFGVPTGISLMHDTLSELKDRSLFAKIHALRDLARLQRNPTKGLLYLFLGLNIDFDELIVKDFYRIFDEDWMSGRLFKKVFDDWSAFNGFKKIEKTEFMSVNNDLQFI